MPWDYTQDSTGCISSLSSIKPEQPIAPALIPAILVIKLDNPKAFMINLRKVCSRNTPQKLRVYDKNDVKAIKKPIYMFDSYENQYTTVGTYHTVIADISK